MYYNLDDVIQDDKEVKLGGVVYKIPAEVTMDKMLRILKTGQDLQANPSDPIANENAVKALFDVFTVRNPELNFDKFKEMLTVKQYAKLIEIVFGDGQKKTQEVEMESVEEQQLPISMS